VIDVTPTTGAAPALRLSGVDMHYGFVRALDQIDFHVMNGEVVALLGDNGAGKSTLMHVAYGLVRPDAGEIRLQGTPQAIASPRHARMLGIGMVHQHFELVPPFTVLDNIVQGSNCSCPSMSMFRRLRAGADLLQSIGMKSTDYGSGS
jgi:ABC-type uncharacterized transport system ATPase subunit